jgi:hypothetical protein
MANPYRSASSQRKLIYFGSILVLFGITIFVRGVVAMPADLNNIGKWSIREQSDRLDLVETKQGDVELDGSVIRLLLTGSRGLAICALWISANEKQVRQEWNAMELQIKQIMKLQPHFLTPWLFQSWNLTYNVSVAMDKLGDMYFYIARGIKLLAEGESINRYNPDMRYAIAFYYQNKFTYSDKVTTLRCLLELSCIPKDERDETVLLSRKDGRDEIDLEKLKAFCEKNPTLVRRMREHVINYGKDAQGQPLLKILAPEPKGVVDFLKENKDVLSRFRDDSPRILEDRLKQFPVLPPTTVDGHARYVDPTEELNPERPIGDGKANGLRASRAWYRYANEAVPPPMEAGLDQFEFRDPERKRRKPKQPALIIFRQGPPRSQSYIAENLAKEGWFDRQDDWIVDSAESQGKSRWFPGEFKVKPTADSREEWEIAHKMWSVHGQENDFLLEGNPELIHLRAIAEQYARLRSFPVGAMMPPPRPEDLQDPDMAASMYANNRLRFIALNLQMTRFEDFLYQAEAEMDPQTIEARRMFFKADTLIRNDQPDQAIEVFKKVLGTQKSLGLWGQILQRRKRFRTDRILELTYEYQLRYLRLVRRQPGKLTELRKDTLTVFDVLRAASPATFVSPYYLAMSDVILEKHVPVLSRVDPFPLPGPYDGLDSDNQEWIPERLRDRVLQTMGIIKPKQASPASRGEPVAPIGPGVPGDRSPGG